MSKWQRDKAQLFIFTRAKFLVRAFRPAMIQQPNAQRSPRTHDARRCHTLPLWQAALLAHLTLTSGSLEGGAQQLWLTGSVLHSASWHRHSCRFGSYVFTVLKMKFAEWSIGRFLQVAANNHHKISSVLRRLERRTLSGLKVQTVLWTVLLHERLNVFDSGFLTISHNPRRDAETPAVL